MKKIATILLIAGLVLLAMPVMAGTPNEDGTCTVPTDEYFITDSPATNGMAVHDGLQNGFVFLIPNTAGYPFHAGNYLGIKEFKLKQSHNEQIKIAMGKLYYCDSLPEVPYVGCTGFDCEATRNSPATDSYVTPAQQHAGQV